MAESGLPPHSCHFFHSTVSLVCNLGLLAAARGSCLSPLALAGPHLVPPGVKGSAVGGAPARVGSVPQAGPPPWGSLRTSNSSWPSTEHLPVPRPVLALSISILPAGTIVMPLCRWGGKDRPKDHPGAELGLEGRAASLGVGSPRSVLAREPETNAQSEYK